MGISVNVMDAPAKVGHPSETRFIAHILDSEIPSKQYIVQALVPTNMVEYWPTYPLTKAIVDKLIDDLKENTHYEEDHQQEI